MISIGRSLYKHLSLIALFLYLFPFQLKALPLSNARVLQIVGFVSLLVYILINRRIFKHILIYILLGCLIFFIGVVSTIVVNNAGQFSFALSKGLYIIFYSCSAFLVVCLMRKAYKPFTPIRALEAIVWVTVVQAIISLVFFCYPNALEMYSNLVIIDDDAMQKMETLNAFRLTGVGSVQFANAAVHYGIALWLLILLYVSNNSYFYNHSSLLCVVGTLFCVCGILSARTFFVILLCTILYVFYIVGCRRILLVISIIGRVFIPLIIIGTGIVVYMIANNLDFIIEWVLELFINIMDSGGVETSSTNELKEMYVWPNTIKTWILGDGMSGDASSGFYMGSDVGYIRSIYYWGLIGSIIYYCAQLKYASLLKRSFSDIRIVRFVNVLLVWFFIYNLKEFWAVEPYWVFLLFVGLFSNQSYVKYNGSNSILSTSISSNRT